MTSLMSLELEESPAVVSRLLSLNVDVCRALGQRLRDEPPQFVLTAGRGSSAHATTFFKYLVETRLGIPVSSAALSVRSIYERSLSLRGQLVLLVSQSGKSPDLLALAESAVASGALVVAVLNDLDAPLGRLAQVCLPMHAGPELAIAATKTHLASLAAVLQLVAAWAPDPALTQPIARLPNDLASSFAFDASAHVSRLRSVETTFVVGRGLGLCVAQEVALKLKEVARIHAEAMGGADLMHGPLALVREGFPILLFDQGDESRSGLERLAASLRGLGAHVFVTPAPAEVHPVCAPLILVASAYRLVHDLARARGCDPDAPAHLRKVTETL